MDFDRFAEMSNDNLKNFKELKFLKNFAELGRSKKETREPYLVIVYRPGPYPMKKGSRGDT